MQRKGRCKKIPRSKPGNSAGPKDTEKKKTKYAVAEIESLDTKREIMLIKN